MTMKALLPSLLALFYFQLSEVAPACVPKVQPLPAFATGIKVGEVTHHEALIWARLTAVQVGDTLAKTNSAPGIAGSVQISYKAKEGSDEFTELKPQPVSPQRDYTAQIKLTGLVPQTTYLFKATAIAESGTTGQTVHGTFITPATAAEVTEVTAVVVTCQGMRSLDDRKQGHWVYSEMLNHQPDLFVHTGDVVYYDKNDLLPFSKTVTDCRQRWARMFSHQWNRDFHSQVSSYFMKDDHDTLKNDCWPGQTYGDMTFEKGLELFAEQTPQGDLPYRRVRWGKDAEFWFIEGRDYRSPNNAPDGPEKTLLGKAQKAWLKKTVQESDAIFKFLVFPSPVVGPDKKGKKDNHANSTFATEGKELREFFSKINNTYLVCGDRHWQYGSQDPETGLIEICSGPINDLHTQRGGEMYEDKNYQFYFGKGKGGFLKIYVNRQEDQPQVTFTWHGDRTHNGAINHQVTYPAQ